MQRLLPARPGCTYVDCTAGLGGHAALIAPGLAPGGTVVLNDSDPGNLGVAAAKVRGAAPGVRVVEFHGNFALLASRLVEVGIRADLVLADLGFASNQMDNPERGFSFMHDGPLDMRLDPTLPLTAADLVNSAPERELTRILGEFGEEKQAFRIARKLCRARQESPIKTTAQLASIVRSVVPRGGSRIDPATRTFQALRIAVNDELGSLEAVLDSVARISERRSAESWLNPGARVGMISFHSLEDRLVKRGFSRVVAAGGKDVSGGAVGPTEAEAGANPRARSAKFRVVEIPS